MVGRRHPPEEVAAKLDQADELAAKGKNQQEITRALGVSVMTYHRWRKSREETARPDKGAAAAGGLIQNPAPELSSEPMPGRGTRSRLEELQLENVRLRKAVTDLLLEKIRLEEEIEQRSDGRLRRHR